MVLWHAYEFLFSLSLLHNFFIRLLDVAKLCILMYTLMYTSLWALRHGENIFLIEQVETNINLPHLVLVSDFSSIEWNFSPFQRQADVGSQISGARIHMEAQMS